MRELVIVLLACLPLAGQHAEAQKKFAGTWEARFKDKVICTIRVKAGEAISGETDACTISVDENGELKEPDASQQPDEPEPMLNPKIEGDTLSFEIKNEDEVLKFEMKLVGEGQAELRILGAPVAIKPIRFKRT